MLWGLADATDIPGLLAAVGFVVFGVWVFVLDPGSRLHRSFATLMVLRGGFVFSVRLGESVYSVFGRTSGYFEVASLFAVLYFGLAYWERVRAARHASSPFLRYAFPTVFVLGVAAVVAYWVDHELLNDGPFRIFFGLTYFSYGVFAWLLARHAVASSEGVLSRSLALTAAFGLAFETAYQATWQWTESLTEIVGGYPGRDVYLRWYIMIDQLGYFGGSVLALVSAAVVYFARSAFGTKQRLFFAVPIVLAALVALPFSMMFAFMLIERNGAAVESWIGVHQVAGGLAMLTGLLVVAYAVLRQRLVNIDWQMRNAVRGTTLAGIFVAIVFVLSEGLQAVLQQRAQESGLTEPVGAVLSVVGAGLVVFLLHPIQRFADRLATRTVPNAKPIERMSHPERIALYRGQSELAWLDGVLRRKERLLLDGLRHRLGIAVEEAAAIETEAMRRTTGAGLENRSILAEPRPPRPRTRSRRA